MQAPIYSAKPYFSEEDVQFILQEVPAILRGQLTMGKWVCRLEELAAEMAGTRYAVASHSCTSALEIGLKSLGVGPGDEVIVPVQTFMATAISVYNVGATPVFCDIDSETHCLDPQDVAKKITGETRAMILVHYGGLMTPHLDDLLSICRQRNVHLVEDAAHAHGAMRNGRPAGSVGSFGAFSYYATKVLTAGGEGGMLTTNDERLHQVARLYQNRGQDTSIEGEEVFIRPGHNVRMTEFAALCGVVQHRHLNEFLGRRQQVADIYAQFFRSRFREIEFQSRPAGALHAYWKFTINLPKGVPRREVQARMKSEYNISVNWSYFPPIHLQPVFRERYGTHEGQCPTAEDVCARCLSLPMHSNLSVSDAEYVCDAFAAVYKSLA